MDFKQIELDLLKRNGRLYQRYSELVESDIEAVYPIGKQIAIIRQKDKKPEEYEKFDAYCEQCKANRKAELGIE